MKLSLNDRYRYDKYPSQATASRTSAIDLSTKWINLLENHYFFLKKEKKKSYRTKGYSHSNKRDKIEIVFIVWAYED